MEENSLQRCESGTSRFLLARTGMTALITTGFLLHLVVTADAVLSRWGDKAHVGYPLVITLMIPVVVGWGVVQRAVT
jgi:hypothetical protein